MSDWLVVWLPVIVAIVGSIIAGIISFLLAKNNTKDTINKMLPAEYKKARAEIAYSNYNKYKNEAYQEIIVSFKVVERDIRQLSGGLPIVPMWDICNLDNLESILESELSSIDIPIVIKAWKESKDKGIEKYRELSEIERKRKCFNSLGELKNSILFKRIYLSDKISDLSDRAYSKLWDANTGYLMGDTELKDKLADEATIIINGSLLMFDGKSKNSDNYNSENILDLMKKDLDQMNLLKPKKI